MSFLNPALLAAFVPLLALPLVIHLLNRHFPHRFKFSAVEHIKETMARRSWLHRWRHLILLALRTLMLALLLVAFLKPFLPKFGANPAVKTERVVLLMFDHSLSMEHKGDGPSARERAIHEAENLLNTLKPEDSANAVLIEQSPSSCFVDFSQNHAEIKRYLRALKPGLTRGDVSQANALAARLLGGLKNTGAGAEIYYLSDFQRKNWASADFTGLPPKTRLFFVDVGSRKRDNRAVLEARPSQSQMLAGDTVALEITVGNFSEHPFQDRLTVTVDRKLGLDQDLFIPPWSVSKVAVPVPVGQPGLHLCEVSLPRDALELDDRHCLALPVMEKEEVLIVSDEPPDRKGVAFFLKMALNPYEDLRGSLLPKVIPSKEISASRLAGVKKIFFTNLGRLEEEAAGALAKHLFQGAGMVYFMDGPADRQNLEALEAAMGPGTLPLRPTAWREATNALTGAQQIVKGDFKSRYLKLFRGTARQDLGLIEVYDYWQARGTGAGNVILAYGDESPAMAVCGHGLGTLLLLNFSARETASNLARQRLFPAWMQELVKMVGADEPPPTAWTVGEVAQAEIWRSDLANAEFISPLGRPVTAKNELRGERIAVSFPLDQLGFYTLGPNRPTQAFAVNPSPDEADLRPIDKEMLPTAMGDEQKAFFVGGRDDFEGLAKGEPLLHWFVLGAVVLLILESGFQLLVRRAKA